MPRVPRVALLIETSRGYGRDMLRGIVNYARLHGPWEFYVTPGDFKQTLPDMERWGGTGIIARVEDAQLARNIVESGLPAILLDSSQSMPIELLNNARCSEIVSDSFGAAQLAAEHLLQRNLKHYAYVGEANRRWSTNRQAGFQEHIREAGFEAQIYPCPKLKRDRNWARELPALADWLTTLPKPVGIMASNDDRGRQVLEACSAANINVPVEALVIGVDNDELLCELAPPPLTSVALNAQGGGESAARLLDRMMQNPDVEPEKIVVQPLHVAERRSTAITLSVEDPDVAAALDYMHTHAAESISIDDIVDRLNISRRMFEIRFRKLVGLTPRQELQRVRLVRARTLLLETELPVAKIAFQAGFCSSAHLSLAFKKECGTTPARYRRSHRP